MIRSTRFGLLLTLIAIAVFGLFWAFLSSRKEASKAEQQEKPNTTSSREMTANDISIMTIKPEDQQQNGIRTVRLPAISQKQALQATAVVLPIQDLISLRNEYVAANAQLEKARASLEVSQHEYERLKCALQRRSQCVGQGSTSGARCHAGRPGSSEGGRRHHFSEPEQHPPTMGRYHCELAPLPFSRIRQNYSSKRRSSSDHIVRAIKGRYPGVGFAPNITRQVDHGPSGFPFP